MLTFFIIVGVLIYLTLGFVVACNVAWTFHHPHDKSFVTKVKFWSYFITVILFYPIIFGYLYFWVVVKK